jgi:formiminoglutamase
MVNALEMISYLREEDVQALTQKRPGETKLGQQISVLENLNNLDAVAAPFVLIGVEEDIGIRANLGRGGASEAWTYFLPAFLNQQANSFLQGPKVALAGSLRLDDWMQRAKNWNPNNGEDLEQLRLLTAQIDQVVSNVLEPIFKAGKTPIVIGGGHNNAYGIIKGCYQAGRKPLSVLNIDPHADFRPREGRHSGNAFSYAYAEEMLKRYAVFGLHQSYNSQEILQQFSQNSNLYYQTYDEWLSLSTQERDQVFKNTLNWLGTEAIGLEFDLDALTGMPASALNPSGFSLPQARLMVKTAAAIKKPIYFHLPEGAPGLAAGNEAKMLIGKSLAYLVTDFIKSW